MKALRAGLCVVIAFTVLAHGVVEVWSESALEMAAAVLLLAWAAVVIRDPARKVHWGRLNWPILSFLAIGLAQLLFRFAAYPFATRTELLKLAAYAIVFFLCTQLFRERADLVGLSWFLIFLGFVVALFGIAQHFTSEGQIYWFRKLPVGGDPFGPYVNRNHFAGFVELVAPVGLALMVFRGLRRDLLPLAGLLTILPVGALILSGSRGGIISFAFEIAVLVMLARNRRVTEGSRAGAIAIVGIAALALTVWIGADKAIARFSMLKQGEVSLVRRATMFEGAMRIFRDHPFAGTGLGSLVAVFPQYDQAYDAKVVDHVHDDYAEVLAEAGMLGGLCGLVFLAFLFSEMFKTYWAEQGHFSRGLHAGAIAAICGLLLHSFVDFNMHIPSNVLLFLLQVHLATSPPLPSEAAARVRGARARELSEVAD
jgi:O-antigen ligase